MTGIPAYNQTLDYLFSRLPMFSRIGKAALKPDLTNTIKLCEGIGNPHLKFKSIHIAGTNGKGSTSHMLAAIFQNCGYNTGLYTSPHLVDFRERIRINGTVVSEAWVVAFVEKHKALIEEVNPSFFEITVAMAFQAFAEAGIDMAIIETGLGGRLDSTNVITPVLSVITNISFDHKDLLGDTLPAIATEKAGIIKPGVPVVIGEQNDETDKVFFEQAVLKQSTIYYADSMWDVVKTAEKNGVPTYKVVNNAAFTINELQTDLVGAYQKANIKTVLASVDVLRGQGYKLPAETVFNALGKVKLLTGLAGRWEVLRTEPLIIADVAHNEAGIGAVMQQWAEVKASRKFIVTGFVRDKDVTNVLALFPTEGSSYLFTNANIPRALPAHELAELAAKAGLHGEVYTSVTELMHSLPEQLHADDAVLVTGSFFVVGEVIDYLANNKW